MRDLFLVTPLAYDLEAIASRLSVEFKTTFEPIEGCIWIRVYDSHIRIDRDQNVVQYFDEPEEIEALKIVGPSPNFFWIQFREIWALSRVMFLIADRSDVVIDNDHWLIEAGDKFIERWKQDPSWDWVPRIQHNPQ
jgi:hypothetical protein